jgi:hypothetical protein
MNISHEGMKSAGSEYFLYPREGCMGDEAVTVAEKVLVNWVNAQGHYNSSIRILLDPSSVIFQEALI